VTGESSTEKLRLFVAIPVPDAVREEMLRVQRELQLLAPRGAVRWARAEQFHLTLRFLGDVSSNRVTALQAAVRAVCSGAPASPLRALGVGFFPNVRSPRVVWVGINDGGRLAELQKKIENVVSPFTDEPGGEHFAGHVTLGRFKQFKRQEIGKLAAGAETMKDRVFGEWTARKIELIRSELSSSGAHYTVLAAFSLGAEIELP
jgi:2'-5' RNA ligase